MDYSNMNADHVKDKSEPRKVSEKTKLKQEIKYLRLRIRRSEAILRLRRLADTLRELAERGKT